MELGEVIFLVLWTIFGLLVGSFLNVCIYRIPKLQFFASTRSFCTHCGHTLSWYELIPVLSFIGLRGRCKKCKSKISLQYPLVEIANAVAYLLCCVVFGGSVWAVLSSIVISTLIVLSGVDLKIKEIPNGSVLIIFLLGLAGFFPEINDKIIWWEKLVGLIVISLPLFIIAFITNGGIGGGDIKLMAAVGLFLGWKLTLLATLFGVVTAGIVGLGLLVAKKKGRRFEMPLGPFLSFGIVLAIFLGEHIIEWYTGLFSG